MQGLRASQLPAVRIVATCRRLCRCEKSCFPDCIFADREWRMGDVGRLRRCARRRHGRAAFEDAPRGESRSALGAHRLRYYRAGQARTTGAVLSQRFSLVVEARPRERTPTERRRRRAATTKDSSPSRPRDRAPACSRTKAQQRSQPTHPRTSRQDVVTFQILPALRADDRRRHRERFAIRRGVAGSARS